VIALWADSIATLNVIVVVLGAAFVVFILVALFAIGVYNRLVALRNRYTNSFSQIDVQLKRRHDLIPNLVETVKAYMAHEKGTLEAVIQARNTAIRAIRTAASQPGEPEAMATLAGAEGQLNGALGRLFAVAEAYPDLKANQNMIALQEELSSTENKVAFARQAYNDAVMRYNTRRETFPDVIVANFFHFTEAKLFQVESEKEREAPRASLT
jgi:LemA protein